MLRYCMLLMLLPLAGLAQKFTAADLKQLKLYSSGTFSNEAQAKADDHFLHAGLTIRGFWPRRKDGAWMFVEKTDTAHSYQVWHFYLQDDTTLVMQFLDFKDTLKAKQISEDSKQEANLYLYNLFTRHGCEVFLKKNKAGFTGNSLGKECFVDAGDSGYFQYSISFTRNAIQWQQTLFNKEDKEQPGAWQGNYIFTKQVKPSK